MVRGQVEVIGQEHQSLASLRVFITDAAQAIGVMLNAARQGQPHDMVAALPQVRAPKLS